MYISNNLKWIRRNDLEDLNLECIWIEIFPENAKSILLGTIYRPPDSSKYLHKSFNEHFENMLSTVISESKESILMGDMNIDYNKRKVNNDTKDIINSYGFKQIIKKPTRITSTSQTTIDVIFTTNKSNISHSDVIPTSISDHDMVGIVRKMNHVKYKPQTIKCRNYSNYDPSSLEKDLCDADWEPLYAMVNVNVAWSFFKEKLQNIYNNHAPLIEKRIKGRPCPWLTSNIKVLINDRDKVLRKARKTNREIDWSHYKSLRNRWTKNIRVAKSNYLKSLLNENANSPRKFWSIIKQIIPNNKGSECTATKFFFVKEEKITDPKQIANNFCNYFTDIANKLKKLSFPLMDFVWRKPSQPAIFTNKRFNFQYISKLFVEKELKQLKRNKSAGLDNLPPGLLKDSAKFISAPLAHIMNMSIKSTSVPNEWKHAKITPIFKSGTHSQFDNYRPISVLPCCSKILEKQFTIS